MKEPDQLTRGKLIELVGELQQAADANHVQQVKTIETLRDSEERLLTILETAVEGIIMIDERGLIESFNPAAEKIFGYATDEVTGQNIKLLMPEPYRHEHDGYLENYRQSGRAKIIGIGREVTGRRKDGTIFPMDLSVSELHLASRRMFTGFVRDITERKEAEKGLLHYAALVEFSDDAIIGKTLDSQITSWNRGAEIIFGYTRDEMVGQSMSRLIPEERQAEEPGILEKIRHGEAVDHYETVRRRKDGRLIDVSVTVSPIRDAAGKIIGASNVARDITERKRLEKEIIEISSREQQRIGQDLHDGLGQELTGIELLCQVLEKKLATKAKAEAKLAGQIAKHVRDAISHTRKLARGLSPVELEINGFTSALHELAAHAQNLFPVKCRLDCPAPVLIRNNVFATHLYRIVQEAVNNAVKHGRAKHIKISLQSADDKITLQVNDDGIGYSKTPPNKTGMGLHTMKYRAGVVGATLAVRSVAGTGTTVTCIFSKNL